MAELTIQEEAVSEAFFAKPMCMSGGAEGADLQFGMVAGSSGHTVIHWSFEDARTEAPRDEVVNIPQNLLDDADPFLKRANVTLGRVLNKHKVKMMNLLRRNWYQVKDSSSVYAVSTIKNGIVQGGTSWAVQMFIDQHDRATCPCYVFDQITDRWYTWVCEPQGVDRLDDPLIAQERAWKGRWRPIEAPPRPTGVYAGIGSRKLLPNGKNAIRALYGYEPPAR